MSRQPQIPAFDLADWVLGHTDRIKHNLTNSSIKTPVLSELGVEIDYDEFQRKRPQLKDAFRSTLAETFRVPERNILVTNSGSEALYLAMGSSIASGDDVLVPTPNYPPAFQVPRLFNASIKHLPTNMENDFKLIPDSVRGAITPRTRLLILTNPNNPSGSTLSMETLQEILEIAHDFPVIVDEAFREFGFENSLPIAATLSENAVSLGTMSKFYGLEDLRIGWIISNEDVIERARNLKNWVTIENSRFSEMLAQRAFENRDKFIARAKKFRTENIEVVEQWIHNRNDVEWDRPDSGLICFPKFKLAISSEELGRKLVDSQGVAVGPGSFFGLESHFRLCFTRTSQEVADGLAALGTGLDALLPE